MVNTIISVANDRGIGHLVSFIGSVAASHMQISEKISLSHESDQHPIVKGRVTTMARTGAIQFDTLALLHPSKMLL